LHLQVYTFFEIQLSTRKPGVLRQPRVTEKPNPIYKNKAKQKTGTKKGKKGMAFQVGAAASELHITFCSDNSDKTYILHYLHCPYCLSPSVPSPLNLKLL
jgi:hypothetical protein